MRNTDREQWPVWRHGQRSACLTCGPCCSIAWMKAKVAAPVDVPPARAATREFTTMTHCINPKSTMDTDRSRARSSVVELKGYSRPIRLPALSNASAFSPTSLWITSRIVSISTTASMSKVHFSIAFINSLASLPPNRIRSADRIRPTGCLSTYGHQRLQKWCPHGQVLCSCACPIWLVPDRWPRPVTGDSSVAPLGARMSAEHQVGSLSTRRMLRASHILPFRNRHPLIWVHLRAQFFFW